MKLKYTIHIVDNETGLSVMRPVKCNGFVIAGCAGPEGKHETVHVRIHNLRHSDLVNVLYTEDKLRHAAKAAARIKPKRPHGLWGKLFGRRNG